MADIIPFQHVTWFAAGESYEYCHDEDEYDYDDFFSVDMEITEAYDEAREIRAEEHDINMIALDAELHAFIPEHYVFA